LAFKYICFRSKVQTEKKNYKQTKIITMNGLFLRISTARIRHPD